MASACSRCCRWPRRSGAVIAVPFGLIALRVRRHTFIVVTIAVFFIFQLMAFNLNSFTGGTIGMSAPFLPWSPTTFNDRFYYITLACAVVAVVIAVLVRRSRFGLQLRAIRDDEDRARGLGVRTMRVKLAAFVLSGDDHGPGRRGVVPLPDPGPAAVGLRPAVRPVAGADGVPRRPRHDLRPDHRRAHHRARPALPDHQVHQRLPQRDPARRAVPAHRAVRAAGHRPDGRRVAEAAADPGPSRGGAGPTSAPGSGQDSARGRADDDRAAAHRGRAQGLRRRARARLLHGRGRARARWPA